MNRSLACRTRAAVIALAAMAAPASVGATPTGSGALVPLGGASASPAPQDLTTAISVSIIPPLFTSGPGQGDMSGIGAGTPVSLSATSWSVTPAGSIVAIAPFTVILGSDTFTFDQQDVTVNTHTGSGGSEHATLAIGFLGSVSGTVTPNPDTASATFTWNQTGGAGGAISWAGTLSHPQQFFSPVPEPSGIAVLGVSLATLGLVRRRRA
jgi:hypothetical protein